MREQFATYAIAIKLKELGFDEECIAIYFRKEFRFIGTNSLKETNSQVNNIDIVDAPLWQQCLDWLREKYSLIITIGDNCGFGDPGFTYSIGKIHSNKLIVIKGSPMKNNDPLIDSYYDAREQAILKSLELIQKK